MIAGEILPWGGHKAILGGVRGLPEAKLRFFFVLKLGVTDSPLQEAEKKKSCGEVKGERKKPTETHRMWFLSG